MPRKLVGAEVLEELEGLIIRSNLKEVLDLILDHEVEDSDMIEVIINTSI